MSDVTRLLNEIAVSGRRDTGDLLPLVYRELRALAHAKLARERDGISMDATELVHEAYLRLVKSEEPIGWETRGHFFSAAAEAMRRILIERARERMTIKRGGDHVRQPFDEARHGAWGNDEKLLQLHEALQQLEVREPERAELVKLRYFAGFTVAEAARLLGISKTKAERSWSFTRAWLQAEMEKDA